VGRSARRRVRGHTRARARGRAVRRRARVGAALVVSLIAVLIAAAPRIAAHVIVGRVNLPRSASTSLPYRDVSFRSGDAELEGWLFLPRGTPRGLVIHQHARMYTRIGGIATAEALVPLGYAVLTFDLRAHGASGGDRCTYGVLEKGDLSRAIDAVGIAPVYVVGHSLGGAVALQAAAEDHRIRAVVAAAPFAELRAAVVDRLPAPLRLASDRIVVLAEAEGGFRFADASPLAAAAHIDVPVLLVHGARDDSTPLADSQRILDALRGPKRLFVVAGAGHTDVLDAGSAAWPEIARFLDALPGT
jgi:uncharacterized protein